LILVTTRSEHSVVYPSNLTVSYVFKSWKNIMVSRLLHSTQ